MTADLASLAITATLAGNWQEAIRINQEILKVDPKDIEALNRLARAYKETGKLSLAKRTYRKVLTIDCFNPIAKKNLKLLEALPKQLKKAALNPGDFNHCSPATFVEEPGKTKIVSLVNLAPASVLLTLCPGNKVDLLIKRRSVVCYLDGRYLGALPDDLSIKLIKRISAGNRYEAFVKTVDRKNLSVFIREVSRAAKFRNQPTFIGGIFYPKETNITFEQEPEENELNPSCLEPSPEDNLPEE